MKRKIVAVVENHFDQIWRRKFRSDFVYKGQNFVSYEKIQRYFIDENIRLSKEIPDYKFQIESPCAVETYLGRFPEREEEIKELYQKGILKTTNTGYVILDSNVLGPEAIIRNYLISDAFFAEFVGKTPEIANRMDAFGNSAQLPQILKAFGAKFVTTITYTPYEEDVWIGLDKSAICVSHHKCLGAGCGTGKYRPCGTCNGFGTVESEVCPTCEGRGIDLAHGKALSDPVRITDIEDSGVMHVGGEELLPTRETYFALDKIAQEKNVDITLGHWDYLLERYSKQIAQIERGDFTGLKVRESSEFNPNNTGGYITRILTKQRLCDAENKILTGETLAAMAQIAHKKPFSYDTIWRNFLLCGFHDSAAGTVVDAGYDEIMELYDEIDKVCRAQYLKEEGRYLFNSTSGTYNGIYKNENGQIAILQNMPPYSCCELCFEPTPTVTNEKLDDGKITIENEYFTVEADEHGILRITDKRFGEILRSVEGKRPCEWVWQSDVGSPWETLEPPCKTDYLSDKTHLVRIEQTENYTALCYQIELPLQMVNAMQRTYINWSLILAKGCDRIRLDADVDFHSSNKRLMLCFPTALENGKDCYGIPGGMLNREPYTPCYQWNSANGDWPAFRFGGVESENKSVAVLNRGTPAYRIAEENGVRTLYVSVLRSPTVPLFLHEPKFYSMNEYNGMRDEGEHHFSFEIAAYGTDFANSCVVKDAEQFSRPPLPVNNLQNLADMPIVTAGSATVTHIKPAEDGSGVILRITEHGGKEVQVTVSMPDWVHDVYLTDMPERKAESLPHGKTLTLRLRAFEIATLRLLPFDAEQKNN